MKKVTTDLISKALKSDLRTGMWPPARRSTPAAIARGRGDQSVVPAPAPPPLN
jgi:hypothetical protein